MRRAVTKVSGSLSYE
uniref:Uncharacterized protein n=1 Tax=Anguilla anguilla TaxID=7936 RepID=A0A0E9UI02_ANGAN